MYDTSVVPSPVYDESLWDGLDTLKVGLFVLNRDGNLGFRLVFFIDQ